MLRIKQTRSPIGTRRSHRETLRSLGLRKIGQTVEQADSGSIRGMIRTVAHLVSFEEIADVPAAEPAKKAATSDDKPKAKTAAAKSTATKKAATKSKSSTSKKTTTGTRAASARSRAKKSE
ncbi:MAG: 50S ribosomal protein L30 [Chloroflexi bacterium]|nr:50S ribosomal protein L30 [Chloroflexota bacterium]